MSQLSDMSSLDMSPQEKKIDLFKRRFHELDVENTGYISRETVAQILRDQGEAIEQLMVILLFEMYDKNGDTFIDLDEYVQFCLEMDGLSERDILRKIFDLCDQDKNHYLDINEVRRLGKMMGLDVTDADAWATIDAFDSNHDNNIDFNEFCAIIGQ